MIVKKLWLAILAAIFVLTACNDSVNPSSTEVVPPPAKKVQIALVMKTLTNPFFITMEQGARQAEKDFGVKLLVKTAAQETSIYQQIDIVERLVRDGNVQAIVIAPGDSVQLIPSLKKAQDQGIKVVNIDNRLDPQFCEKYGLKEVPFISVDNQKAAYLSARYIAEKISSPTKAAILEGIPTASNAQERKAGAEQAFAENPHIQLVASETAHWKVDEAYEVVKGMFALNPDIGAIFCANDMMAMGVVRFLMETDRRNLPIASFDAIESAKEAIREGKLTVSIDQRPDLQGYMGVQTAVDMLNGKTPAPVTFVDGVLIDRTKLQ